MYLTPNLPSRPSPQHLPLLAEGRDNELAQQDPSSPHPLTAQVLGQGQP